MMGLDTILGEVEELGVPHVTVTGGEPLAQPNAIALMQKLVDAGKSVSLETSGALSVADVPAGVVKVLDLKTPGSNESHRNLWENLGHLNPRDQIKFVLCSRADYDWARMRCDEHGLYDRVGDVLFSPSHHELAPRELADWIVADRLPVRMQMQMHKLLWGDVPGY
jgi:7-carboxy-7-deazaguanine synthase